MNVPKPPDPKVKVKDLEVLYAWWRKLLEQETVEMLKGRVIKPAIVSISELANSIRANWQVYAGLAVLLLGLTGFLIFKGC